MKIFNIFKFRKNKKEENLDTKKNLEKIKEEKIDDNETEIFEDKNIKLNEKEIFTIFDKSDQFYDNKDINEFEQFDKNLNLDNEIKKTSIINKNDYEYFVNSIDENDNINLEKPPINKLTPEIKNNFDDVVVLTLDDLTDYYKKKSQEKYFIVDDEYKNDFENYEETERNRFLNKFSDDIAKNILKNENNDLIENESIDIIEDNMEDESIENLNEELNENLNENEINLDYIESYNKDEENNLNNNNEEIEKNKRDLNDLKNIFIYLDELFEKLPKDKIKKFVQSDYFKLYKKLMYELNIKKS